MNMGLLGILRSNPDQYYWAEALGRSLGIPLVQVLRELKALEDFGFELEQAPLRGIRYVAPPRRLCPDQIEWQLGTQTIGRRIEVWQRVTSTNDVAANAAHSGGNDGLVVMAEEQTAGRGRRHRRWYATPESSILMSVLVFPPLHVRSASLLTCLAALAVVDVVISTSGLPARIKWPNDVRVAGRKICGVLVEDLARRRTAALPPNPLQDSRSGSPNSPPGKQPGLDVHDYTRATVIGLGLNVNVDPEEFPPEVRGLASSLMALCGRRLDRSDLAGSLIQRLDYYYQHALSGNSSLIWDQWSAVAELRRSRVCIHLDETRMVGTVVDLHPNTGIKLELHTGQTVQIDPEGIQAIEELTGEGPIDMPLGNRPNVAADRDRSATRKF